MINHTHFQQLKRAGYEAGRLFARECGDFDPSQTDWDGESFGFDWCEGLANIPRELMEESRAIYLDWFQHGTDEYAQIA